MAKFSKIDKLDNKTQKDLTNAVNDIDQKEITVLVADKRYKPKEKFCIIFIEKVCSLLKGDLGVKLTGLDFQILMQYVLKMQYGNQISISQTDIAEELEITKQAVNRTVKKLLDAKVFYKDKNSLYLDWRFFAKGNLYDFFSQDQEKNQQIQEQKKLVK